MTENSTSTGNAESSLDLGSRLLLYMFVLGPVALLFVFLFAVGPLGWIAIATLVFAGIIFQAGRTHDASSTQRPERTNCPSCGAPNDVDTDTCTHCGDAVSPNQGE